MSVQDKTGSEFFEERYKRSGDPWNFTGSEYEQGRFETIIAALSPQRFRHALEPGCSIGTLTIRLAAICDRVTAFDFSATATASAAQRCAALPHVQVTCAALTEKTPVAGYDLILLSELGYYFRPEEWRVLVAILSSQMNTGTTVLASHWLGESDEHRQEGDAVHQTLREEPLLQWIEGARHPGFQLDKFTRL